LTAALPPGVPLVQYFLDYLMSPGLGSERYLRRVLARADEVWALTEEIADAVGRVAAKFGKSVRVQPGFHLDLPAVWKQTHRAAGASDFTCVICGNFWQHSVALIVKRVWLRVQQAVPGLGPIEWTCHPESVRRTEDFIGSLKPEIQPGFYSVGAELFERLARADMALIPFNVHRAPENKYARYSLPSRLTELLSVGLPVFCIAGAETPLARYVLRNQLGAVCDAEDEERLAQQLAGFIRDREARAAAGARGRQFAEREFALGPFQEFLHAKLTALAALNDGTSSAFPP
jgi:glycosyltransferase involved in cell wall biosynthesis